MQNQLHQVFREPRQKQNTKELQINSKVSVFTQIFLGMATVAQNIAIIPTTAHLAVGALILVFCFKFSLMLNEGNKLIFGNRGDSVLSDILSLFKPKLASLVITTILAGMLLADGHISFFKGLYYLILMSGVVGAAAILNCYLEKKIDGQMDRTKNRPLPAGRLNSQFVLTLGVVILSVSLYFVFTKINFQTGILSVVASFYLYAPLPLC